MRGFFTVFVNKLRESVHNSLRILKDFSMHKKKNFLLKIVIVKITFKKKSK